MNILSRNTVIFKANDNVREVINYTSHTINNMKPLIDRLIILLVDNLHMCSSVITWFKLDCWNDTVNSLYTDNSCDSVHTALVLILLLLGDHERNVLCVKHAYSNLLLH